MERRSQKHAPTPARAIELCLEVYQDKGWPLPASDAEPRRTIKELVPVKLA